MHFGKVNHLLFQKRKTAAQTDKSDCHPVLITFDKQQCYQQAEDCNSTQYNPHSPSYRIQEDIKQYGSQPETKMRKNVHHHVKDHRRGRPFYTDIGFQLHDAVRLPSHQSDGSHIIKSKAGNGEFVETGKRESRFAAATDDDIPRYCINQIDQ